MNVGSAAPTTHIMASAWQSRSSTLSTLDVLTALEARSVQQDEATLHRLVEDLLTQGRIVEGLIATLEAETALRDDGTLSPAKVSVALPQSGVPAPIRPHLRWLMRALLVLRTPQVLAHLLVSATRPRAQPNAGSPLDIPSIVEAVGALIALAIPGDTIRGCEILLSLWSAEIAALLTLAPAPAPSLAAATAADGCRAVTPSSWRRSPPLPRRCIRRGYSASSSAHSCSVSCPRIATCTGGAPERLRRCWTGEERRL